MTNSSTDFRLNDNLSAYRAFFICLAASFASICAPIAGAAEKQVPLNNISAIQLDGRPTTLAALIKGPTVLNIWATWCPPCRTEMPSLEGLSRRLAPEGIDVVALSVDTDHNLVREFLLKYRIDLPVAIAAAPQLAMDALKADALPMTIYLDAKGRIVGRHIGLRDWASNEALEETRGKIAPR